MNLIMKQKSFARWGIILAFSCSAMSCQSWDKWDDPSANQQIETPEPPEDTSAKLLAKYTFEGNLTNESDNTVIGELRQNGTGQVPSFESNAERGGTVLHQFFGASGAESYTRFVNPLKGIDGLYGASVNIWVNRQDDNVWDAIWGFLDEDSSDGVDGRFYLTPNAYLGFNGTGGWFDCNWPDNVTNAIPVREWSMVTMTVDPNGFKIYVDGDSVYSNTKYLSWGANDNTASGKFYYQSIVNLLKSSSYFYLGHGSWWGSANLLLDDLQIYQNPLTAAEVSALYNSYSGLAAFYNFDSNITNVVDQSVSGELKAGGTGSKPVYEANEARGGTVLHQYFGISGAESYAAIPNPLKGLGVQGATVSLWVNRLDSNVWDAIWSFFDDDDTDGVSGRLYLTPNAYIGFNGTGGWFDCNWPDNVTSAIPTSTWSMVTVTIDSNGFTIYVDGVKKYDKTTYLAWASNDGTSPLAFNYGYVTNLLNSSSYFYLGKGSWWGSAALLLDNLSIYKRTLSETEVSDLYESSK